VCAQHTPAVVDAVGERRSMWWVLAELGRRLGHQLADTTLSDDAMLASLSGGGRCSFEELAATGYAEAPRELPAPWVESHVSRLGGWRLSPPLLVDQLAGLRKPAPLVLVPRRQRRRLNSQLEYLGEPAEVVIHPGDAAVAGVVAGQPVTVRSAHGELTGIAKVDSSIRPGAVSVPHGHADANVNLLTSKDDIDLVTGMTRYSGVPVTLHPGGER
jgi:anaerobic selenocysteine-containing dehydrogenase